MDEVALKCPVCGGTMIRAIGLRGPKPGSSFWGCENYPDCIPIIKDKDVDAEIKRMRRMKNTKPN